MTKFIKVLYFCLLAVEVLIYVLEGLEGSWYWGSRPIDILVWEYWKRKQWTVWVCKSEEWWGNNNKCHLNY